MSQKIAKHPILLEYSSLFEICAPLSKLNITYFTHVHIDKNKAFSALSNNPHFAKHYLTNHYFNADIHLAESKKLGPYVIWDAIERRGQSEKMHTEAAAFGVQHTFTIVEQSSTGMHYYHFANADSSRAINQIYLANLDLLKLFTIYFNESVAQSKKLSSAYDIKFRIDPLAAGYQIVSDKNLFVAESDRQELLQLLSRDKIRQEKQTKNPFPFIDLSLFRLTDREAECLYLVLRGKTAALIAEELNISKRTVETHMNNIKYKMQVNGKTELIEKIMNIFLLQK